MSPSLSRRAWVWIMGLLLGAAGLMLLTYWALSPSERKQAPSAEDREIPEIVAPVAEPVQVKPQPLEIRDTTPTIQAVRLESPTQTAEAKPDERAKDGGALNGLPMKKFRGLMKWMSGTVGTSPSGTK